MGGVSAVKKAYNNCTKSFKSQHALFVPFLIFAFLEALALTCLYLAPRMPLKLIFGPIIKTFWGEAFLHYPANFVLLPKLASLSRMCLAVIFGSLLTGVAVGIVYSLYSKKEGAFKPALKTALKKYASLFIIVLIFTTVFYFSVKLINIAILKYFMAGHNRLLFLGAKLWLGPILFAVNFIFAVIIQSAFIYAIPLLIIENKKLVPAIIGSFVLFKKLFFSTLIMVTLPMLLYLPIVILTDKATFLIDKVSPESVLWVCLLSVVVSSLIIDPLITVGTTYLYLERKK